jgi:hypothetical protein
MAIPILEEQQVHTVINMEKKERIEIDPDQGSKTLRAFVVKMLNIPLNPLFCPAISIYIAIFGHLIFNR